ncbi:MAG TPA: hypothetical protein VHR65_02265, partial [Solirubrobacterales bacterium]|nr:hypothetical protein [Solirubrobacterales bacterium]
MSVSRIHSRYLMRALALAMLALGLTAAPALAAPQLGVTLSNEPTTMPRSDMRQVYTARVSNSGSTATAGTVTVKVEMPGGSETFVVIGSGTGWSCLNQQPVGETHAFATCTRSDALASGTSYPLLTVFGRLGSDAPETGAGVATVSGGGSPVPPSVEAQYTLTPGLSFGILENSFKAEVRDKLGSPYTPAGGHPFTAFTTLGFNTYTDLGTTGNKINLPIDRIKDTIVDAPRGFVGSARALPELCPSIEMVILQSCPIKSMVGGTDIYAAGSIIPDHDPYPSQSDLATFAFPRLPIYALEPEFGAPAEFAFAISAVSVPYTFVTELRPEDGYAISFRTAPIIQTPAVYGANVTICDFGGKREGVVSFTIKFSGCKEPTEVGANPLPLITNPTRCAGPPPHTGLKIDSWQEPGFYREAGYDAEAVTECGAVPFEPESKLTPTSHQADSPTGLDVELTMPTEGLETNTGVSQASLDTVTVTLPKGMSVNPSLSSGLGACTQDEVKLNSDAEAQCPESSKVGTVEIETPLIREKLTGAVYVARQNDNPFNSLLGLYMVFSSARDGITIKVAGKLTPDPVTGQLTSVFTENPEAPFSKLVLHFTAGPRAALVNPPKCGSYAIHSEFSPWSAVDVNHPTPEEIVSQDSSYEVSSGPNGGPCPPGNLEPKLNAGLQNTQAGSKSPFVFSLSREDGTQRLAGIDLTLPQGLTAYLKGIPYCSDTALGSISSTEGTGEAQIANPSCPAASQIGTSTAGAGAGPNPFYVKTGKAYLAGPYKGAPLSIAIVTPAVAGPFDLGNVVVRTPLYVNRETAQVSAKSDPIPTILHGILLDVRDVRVNLDRQGFTAAPTNCEPKSIEAKVTGESGATANLSNRFQVGGCENLAFKPKLGFRLFGGTHRGSHPRLRATLTMPEGGAN